MVREFKQPVNVSPLIRLGRYTALIAGIAYGVCRNSYLQRKEDEKKVIRQKRHDGICRPSEKQCAKHTGEIKMIYPAPQYDEISQSEIIAGLNVGVQPRHPGRDDDGGVSFTGYGTVRIPKSLCRREGRPPRSIAAGIPQTTVW
ncbi:ATP synthase, F0 complex, subunit E, mitochondrial [Cinara cedri]|uniref:ATP synthase F(0) complex subunit e, mitochondrial n=1 Tax=Cinara cedri TaxID=506608 RepID=A0A5E4MH41_9HEMI|nr:ATP synthase, F0 complex, subunit E, mitochondrial [Cinara cedri]